MAMALSWYTLSLVCLLSLAALSGSAKQHKSRSRGQNQEHGPAWGPHRASFVNGTDELDWSRDPRRVDKYIYDQSGAWDFFSWPYALAGQLEGQELPAGLVKGDRVKPKSKGQLLSCNGYFNYLLNSLWHITPDHHLILSSGESKLIQYLEKYPILHAEDFLLPNFVYSPKLCPKIEVPCTTYKLQSQPETLAGKIEGKFAERLRQLLRDYGPLALYMDAHDEPIGADGFLDHTKRPIERQPEHVVLLVGYGRTDSGIDYFKFKNSRGPEYGDHGYGYIRIGDRAPLHGMIELLNIRPCPKKHWVPYT